MGVLKAVKNRETKLISQKLSEKWLNVWRVRKIQAETVQKKHALNLLSHLPKCHGSEWASQAPSSLSRINSPRMNEENKEVETVNKHTTPLNKHLKSATPVTVLQDPRGTGWAVTVLTQPVAFTLVNKWCTLLKAPYQSWGGSACSVEHDRIIRNTTEPWHNGSLSDVTGYCHNVGDVLWLGYC